MWSAEKAAAKPQSASYSVNNSRGHPLRRFLRVLVSLPTRRTEAPQRFPSISEDAEAVEMDPSQVADPPRSVPFRAEEQWSKHYSLGFKALGSKNFHI